MHVNNIMKTRRQSSSSMVGSKSFATTVRKRKRDGMKSFSLNIGASTVREYPNISINEYKCPSHVVPVRSDMLWRLSLLFAAMILVHTTGALDSESGARYLSEQHRRLMDEKIRDRFLQDELIDVIVSFKAARGNVDPDLTSDYTRTNAKVMRGITLELYNSLLDSDEVLAVDLDVHVSTANTVYVNNEAVPWGADLILQSTWDGIPNPSPSDPPMKICVVDSGLLLSHPDIVSHSPRTTTQRLRTV